MNQEDRCMIKNISIKSGHTLEVNWDLVSLASIKTEIEAITNTIQSEELTHCNSFKSESRKFECISVRFLKHHQFGESEIQYSNSGQPYLKDLPSKIGISHSKTWAVFASSDKSFGCDIEDIHERILKVKSRFCSDNERLLMASYPETEALTALWAGKESCYKLIQDESVNWKEDLNCNVFGLNLLKFEITSKKEKRKVHCTLKKIENSILAIAVYE